MKFLFQHERFVPALTGKHLTSDASVFLEAIAVNSWMHPESHCKVSFCSEADLPQKNVKNKIPIGSVSFTNKVLEMQGRPPLLVLNVPEYLRTEAFAGRKTAVVSAEDVLSVYTDWNTDKLFIKSNERLKAEFTGVYTKSQIQTPLWLEDELPDKEELFVSEVVDFVSEWRCFVYEKMLYGIRNYTGDEFVIPSKQTIEQCIEAVGDRFGAYVLDVGVLQNGKTVVVEMHEFMSCGLYGYEDKMLLPMLIKAYRERQLPTT